MSQMSQMSHLAICFCVALLLCHSAGHYLITTCASTPTRPSPFFSGGMGHSAVNERSNFSSVFKERSPVSRRLAILYPTIMRTQGKNPRVAKFNLPQLRKEPSLACLLRPVRRNAERRRTPAIRTRRFPVKSFLHSPRTNGYSFPVRPSAPGERTGARFKRRRFALRAGFAGVVERGPTCRVYLRWLGSSRSGFGVRELQPLAAPLP